MFKTLLIQPTWFQMYIPYESTHLKGTNLNENGHSGGNQKTIRFCFFQSGFRDLKNDRIWCFRFFQTERTVNRKKSGFRDSPNKAINTNNKSIFTDLEAGDCSVLVFFWSCFCGLSLRLLRLFPAATSSEELSPMVLNRELHWLKRRKQTLINKW